MRLKKILWIDKQKEISRTAKNSFPKIILDYSSKKKTYDKKKLKKMKELHKQMLIYDSILSKLLVEITR